MTVTWNPSDKHSRVALSGGNLTATVDTNGLDSLYPTVRATEYKSAGKWFWEVSGTKGPSGGLGRGIATSSYDVVSSPSTNYLGYSPAYSYGYTHSGSIAFNNSVLQTVATYTTGDVIGIALDLDLGELTFFKNGVQQGTTVTGVAIGNWAPAVHGYDDDVSTANFGDTAFAYPASMPTGFIAYGSGGSGASGGQGDMVLSQFTVLGQRVSAGAVILQPYTAVGGRLPFGEVVLQSFTVSSIGGTKSGVITFQPFTVAGTGHDANEGVIVFESFMMAGTGQELSFNKSVLIAPSPTLVSTILAGALLQFSAAAPIPLLVVTGVSPIVITASNTVVLPTIQATLLTGNILTALLTTIVPILAATGYSAFTITFEGKAPLPRLESRLSAAILEAYRTWVLNTRKLGLTEYTNFSFNSFALFNGKVLAVGANGVVELGTQDFDNATQITARVRTGKNDFDSSMLKRVPRIYTGLTTDGDMIFRTVTSEGGERAYLLNSNGITDIQQRRVPVGKGPKSRFWQFEVENKDGADFSIHDVLVYPTDLRRRAQ